ncbi:unnamed protein product [Parnassius mnemosyne]|uniref:Uncharacterized protein n=1 Tax=Parnassius mnemosyne TaxID=213953 RepID=A0AAV1M6L6_9NEOP
MKCLVSSKKGLQFSTLTIRNTSALRCYFTLTFCESVEPTPVEPTHSCCNHNIAAARLYHVKSAGKAHLATRLRSLTAQQTPQRRFGSISPFACGSGLWLRRRLLESHGE